MTTTHNDPEEIEEAAVWAAEISTWNFRVELAPHRATGHDVGELLLYDADGAQGGLVTGKAGSGKTEVAAQVARAAAANGFTTTVFTPHGPTDKALLDAAPNATYTDPADPAWTRALTDLARTVTRRSVDAHARLEKGHALTGRVWRPSDSEPLLLVVAEEFHRCAPTAQTAALWDDIVNGGWAVGVAVLATLPAHLPRFTLPAPMRRAHEGIAHRSRIRL